MKRILASLTLFMAVSQPLLGQTLEVTSEPSDCIVAIDHKIVGRTPFTLEKFESGKHVLRVAKDEEFHPFTVTVELDQASELKKHVVLEPLTSTHLQRGIAALRQGRIESGERSLEASIAGSPTQPDAHWWLARLKAERGDLGEALRHARLYARVRPTSEVHLLLGDLHRREGRLAEAVTSYKLALLASPQLEGRLEGLRGATWETIKAFGEPTEAGEQMRLAYLYELKGMIPEALDWLKQAVSSHFVGWPPAPLLREVSQTSKSTYSLEKELDL